MSPALITKITKAFYDGICIILDGMALLASNDRSTAEAEGLDDYTATSITNLNSLRTIDSRDSVRH